jgi:predicted dehydrogenase
VDWATQLIGPAAEVWSDLRRVNAAGDAEDQVRLMLRSGSGAIADLEFGGACALPQPGWHVLGTLGAFQIDNKTATLRYIDLDAAPDAPTLNTEAPPRGNGFGGGKLEFIEASYEIDREVSPGFWDAVVATLRHDEPFPITLDQARENMRIIDAARQGTPFQMTEAEPMICSG